jgi:hypothetical protein
MQGSWQGDSFTVEADALRDMPPPCSLDGGVCPGTITETIEGRLFGEAQIVAGGCASLPQGDAGLSGYPFVPDGGLDVRLVCGYITDEFKPDIACGCAPCLVVYKIAGERQ